MLKHLVVGLMAWGLVLFAFSPLESPQVANFEPQVASYEDLGIRISQNAIIPDYYLPMPKPEVRAIIVEEVKKQPTKQEGYDLMRKLWPEKVDNLFCLWEKESTWGKTYDWRGDNGRAWGHFQIWISANPISEECAMDFECSLKWTIKEIKSGNAWKWPPAQRDCGF